MYVYVHRTILVTQVVLTKLSDRNNMLLNTHNERG